MATNDQPTAMVKQEEKTLQRPPNQKFGVVPAGFDEAWRMATAISRSELAPKDFREKPENCFIAMQMGAELGLSPMASLRSIAVINGRPSIWGDGALAVVQAHPEYETHQEFFEGTGDEKTAVFKIKRRNQELHIVRFSVADAKRAELWGSSRDPWKKYPDRMLQMRARSWGLRDKFADALCGLAVAEEALDMPLAEGIVVDAKPELPANIQRASELAKETKLESPPAADPMAEARKAQETLNRQREEHGVPKTDPSAQTAATAPADSNTSQASQETAPSPTSSEKPSHEKPRGLRLNFE